MPQLPMDWRSAIDNALASNKPSRGFQRIGEAGFIAAQTEEQSPSTCMVRYVKSLCPVEGIRTSGSQLEIPHWMSSNYLTSSTDSRNTSSRSSTPSLKKKRRVYQVGGIFDIPT